MVRLDLIASVSRRSTAPATFSGHLRLCVPGLLLCGFCIFGSAVADAQEEQATQQQSQAQQDQNQQAQDQDIAKAARAERARKQAYPRKPRHVYTAEDLKRDQILTPEDRVRVEARKNKQTPLDEQSSQDALDAQTLPPDAPLGDVARSLRRQKELMRLRRSLQLRIPLLEAPVFAAPKPPAEPLRPPATLIEPIPPREIIGPFHPPVKRSPFERPRMAQPEFKAPRASSPELPRVVPPAPEKPQALVVTPSAPRTSPAAPKLPRSAASAPEMPHAIVPAPLAPQASPAAPKVPRNLNASKPAHPSVKAPEVVLSAPQMQRSIVPAPIVPGPSVAPTAPKAPQNVLRATPAHPSLKAPRAIVPAAPVYRANPAKPSIAVAPPAVPGRPGIATRGKVVTVQLGDSLWKIAEQHLGNGLRWQELLSVNPGISDPSRIIAGSQILLPAVDSAPRSAKYTVEKGDTLWSIAESQLGRATAWSCIAKANAKLRDANFIREGQVLVLPASCPR